MVFNKCLACRRIKFRFNNNNDDNTTNFPKLIGIIPVLLNYSLLDF
jgi:hypothetical protein